MMTYDHEPVEVKRKNWNEYEIVIVKKFYSGSDLSYYEYQINRGEMTVVAYSDQEFEFESEAYEAAVGSCVWHRQQQHRLQSPGRGVGSLLKEIAAERAAARANSQPVQIMRREPLKPKSKGKTTNRGMFDQ